MNENIDLPIDPGETPSQESVPLSSPIEEPYQGNLPPINAGVQSNQMTVRSKDLGEKPNQVTILTIMTLISGVTNIIAALSISLIVVVSTIGLGLLCVPITILPGILGIFEILYAVKLLSNPPTPVKPSQTIAILEICDIVFLNAIAVVTGILALVFYNDPKVQEYFVLLNSGQLNA